MIYLRKWHLLNERVQKQQQQRNISSKNTEKLRETKTIQVDPRVNGTKDLKILVEAKRSLNDEPLIESAR